MTRPLGANPAHGLGIDAATLTAVMTWRSTAREGAMRVIFVDADGNTTHQVEMSEGTHNIDELFLRHLVDVIVEIGSASVVIAVRRRDGRALHRDRTLAREATIRLTRSSTSLQAVLLVGDAKIRQLGRRSARAA